MMSDNNFFQLRIDYFNFEKKVQQQLELYFFENIKLLKRPDGDTLNIGIHIYFFTGVCNIDAQMLERSEAANARILCIGQFDDFENFLSCVQTGSYGCIFAINMLKEIIPAILSVLRNKIYISPSFVPYINAYFKGNCDNYSHRFTTKENKLIQLLTEGALYKEIAWKLSISENTVRSHVRNIYSKLKVHSKTELTRKILNATLNLQFFSLFSDYIACLCY